MCTCVSAWLCVRGCVGVCVHTRQDLLIIESEADAHCTQKHTSVFVLLSTETYSPVRQDLLETESETDARWKQHKLLLQQQQQHMGLLGEGGLFVLCVMCCLSYVCVCFICVCV